MDIVLNFTIEDIGARKPFDMQTEIFQASFAAAVIYDEKWIIGEGMEMKVFRLVVRLG